MSTQTGKLNVSAVPFFGEWVKYLIIRSFVKDEDAPVFYNLIALHEMSQ